MSMHKGLIGKSDGGGSADLTLGDYITRKQRQDAFDQVAQEKKLTFDEWFAKDVDFLQVSGYGKMILSEDELKAFIRDGWYAGQENK